MKRYFEILKHLIVWLFIIVFCNASNYIWQGFKVEDGTMLVPSIYGTAFNALLVYFNALCLYPKKGKKLIIYWLWASLVIFLASVLEGILDYYYSKQIGLLDFQFTEIRRDLRNEDLNFDLEKSLPLLTLINFSLNNLFVHVLFWILSFAYILPIENAKNKLRREQLEKEKLRAEVNFLKAQINPHSLFNGINSIYHLIDKDKERAKDVLSKFSELLRYQVYESSNEKISLSKEILFLENYVNLEKIRKADSVVVDFSYNLHETDGLNIAPILFIPFLENAFKYVSNYKETELNYIKCCIKVVDDVLKFKIVNSIDGYPDTLEKADIGGVGLTNTKERLKLVYPDRHLLKIDYDMETFEVELTIKLNE